MTAAKKRNIKILISIASVLLIVVAAVFYLFNYKYYIVYGIADSFRRAEKDLLIKVDYNDNDLVSVPLSDIEAGFAGIGYNSEMWLVNGDHPLTADADIMLAYADEEHEISEDVLDPLNRLFAACQEACGETLLITSGYRSYDVQAWVYEKDPSVAVPAGESEHQCGYAIDLKVDGFAQRRFIMSAAGKWIAENCYKYGFIIRYPFWGQDKTNVTYEPWHIRYVGEPHAELIYKMKITLEEYALLFEDGAFYGYGNYIISHQNCENGEITMPKGITNIQVSSDNAGGYYIWGSNTIL